VTGIALLAALQALTARAEAPAQKVLVGDQVAVRLTVRGRSTAPVSVPDPGLEGVILLGRRGVSDVSFPAGEEPLRTSTVTYDLRAIAAGQARVGPWRIDQGRQSIVVSPVAFAVLPSLSGATAALSAVAEQLLARAPPPRRADEVSISVLLSADTVRVGEQFDMVVAAWFPRDVRSRLRRPPAIVTVPPGRVWQYPQSAAPGVATSRQVRGVWMDVYAAHLVLFPLQPGPLEIPAQRLEYALPVTSSFFSREERYALSGEPRTVVVRPTPTEGRHPLDAGVVGRDLELSVEFAQVSARAGEPLEVLLAVSGRGNVALWPPPVAEWPHGFRAYPGEPTVTVAPSGGAIAGTKRFKVLLVPDSAGAFSTPAIDYPYWDLGRNAYRVARVGPRPLTVAPSGLQGPARASPPLALTPGLGWARRLTAGFTAAHVLVLVLLGPVLFAAIRWRPGRRTRHATPGTRAIERLEGEFARLLSVRAGRAAVAETTRLVAALRAAGVDGTLAEHAGRLRERLRAARYAPQRVGEAADLADELEQVIRALTGEASERARRRAVMAGLTALVLSTGGSAVAQQPEALYDMGALRAAADSFATRAGGAPHVADHWYNLGAAVYRAGADGRAVAAWTAAARLAPRDRSILRARAYLPAPDATSGSLLWAAPVTPREMWFVAGLCWIAAWVAVARRARRRISVPLFAATVVAGSMGLWIARRYDRPVAVLTASVPLREAPYGGAPSAVALPEGTAVEVAGHWPGWVLATRPDGQRGWLLAAEVVSVPRVW